MNSTKVEICATHPQSRDLHAIEEGRLELGQIAHEISAIVVTFNLRHLEAIVFLRAVLLCITIIDIDCLREVGDVTPVVLNLSVSLQVTL